MTPLDSNRLVDSAAQGLAADARSLDALKRTAARDPQAALKSAAQQFEALFLQMVLKSMRDAVPKSGLLDSDSQQTYTSMLDQQLAAKISKSGTGLADVIAKQLGRYVTKGETPAGATAPAPLTNGRADAAPPGASASRAARTAIDRYAEFASGDGLPANDDVRLGTAQRTFVNRIWDHALAAEHATGIPAKFVIAQAALESGWGQREIRDAYGLPTFNLFGIKAGSGWQGRTVEVVTTEYNNGVANKVVEKFRAYNNYSEAFRDWARLIAGNKRYAQVMEAGRAGDSAAHYANGLARAGYATDPQYGAKLARVIGSLAGVRAGAV